MRADPEAAVRLWSAAPGPGPAGCSPRSRTGTCGNPRRRCWTPARTRSPASSTCASSSVRRPGGRERVSGGHGPGSVRLPARVPAWEGPGPWRDRLGAGTGGASGLCAGDRPRSAPPRPGAAAGGRASGPAGIQPGAAGAGGRSGGRFAPCCCPETRTFEPR